jgi:hypothetical protein
VSRAGRSRPCAPSLAFLLPHPEPYHTVPYPPLQAAGTGMRLGNILFLSTRRMTMTGEWCLEGSHLFLCRDSKNSRVRQTVFITFRHRNRNRNRNRNKHSHRKGTTGSGQFLAKALLFMYCILGACSNNGYLKTLILNEGALKADDDSLRVPAVQVR